MSSGPMPAGAPWYMGLRQQMLLALTFVTVVVISLLYAISSQRLDKVSANSTRDWAGAVARLAAIALVDSLSRRDADRSAAVLHDIASLPGVREIETRDPEGRALLRLQVLTDGRILLLGSSPSKEASQDASTGTTRGGAQSGSSALGKGLTAQRMWAPVGQRGQLGSVGVSVSTAAMRERMALLLYDTVLALGLAAVLIISMAGLLVSRALRPLDRAVRFARNLADGLGEQLPVRRGSREIASLSLALNHASTTVRTQLEHIRGNEHRTHAIVYAVPDAILGFDTDGLINIASPATASIFGREPDGLVGVPISQLLPGLGAADAEQRTLDGLYMRSSNSHVARFETVALRHGGTEFPVEVSLSRVASEQGIRFACVVRDLTEKNMVDNMLNLYRRALECTSNGVVITDMRLDKQPIFYVNPAFTAITGYAPIDAIGRNQALLQREDVHQPELAQLQAALAAGESTSVVMRSYRQDGSLFFNEQSIAPVVGPDGAVSHYVAVLSDVTERERTRLAVAERSARMNTVFDLSPDGFVVFDAVGDLVFCNQAFLSMTGSSGISDMVGLSVQAFDQRMAQLCDPDAAPSPLSRLWADQADVHPADGACVLTMRLPQTRIVSRAVRRQAQGPSETIVFLRDITHESEVDRMKSEFLTTAAHELRTPMVSVFGFTELLLNRPVPEHRRRDVLETIHRQSSLLIQMVNELLDLARIEARQGKDLKYEVCDLMQLTTQACDSMMVKDDQRQIQLHWPADAVLRVKADPEKLLRGITNVLSNAFKYSPRGSDISVDTVPGEIQGAPALALRITDHGVGMSEEQCARVFERFYRVDPSGNIPGTGLGMSLVKEIVELHGGRVSLTSRLGEGTQVSLWLPLLPAPATLLN
jgi:PAS domain S-box-containing protein